MDYIDQAKELYKHMDNQGVALPRPKVLISRQQPITGLWGIGYYPEDDELDGVVHDGQGFVWIVEPNWNDELIELWRDAMQGWLEIPF